MCLCIRIDALGENTEGEIKKKQNNFGRENCLLLKVEIVVSGVVDIVIVSGFVVIILVIIILK